MTLNAIFQRNISINRLFPPGLQKLDELHWSPINVIRQASDFLVQGEAVNVLDIGSGCGKFCLAAGYYQPGAHFYGVEQREWLVNEAVKLSDRLGLNNVHFMHKNFTQLDLRQYDHFYFFNSFFENLSQEDKIDDTIDYCDNLYTYYTYYLFKELEQLPAGTRIVTYCSWGEEIPPGYRLKARLNEGVLKYWEKE